MTDPYQLAYNTMINALRHGQSNSPVDKANEIKHVNFDDVLLYSGEWKQHIFGEIYIAGNMTK